MSAGPYQINLPNFSLNLITLIFFTKSGNNYIIEAMSRYENSKAVKTTI